MVDHKNKNTKPKYTLCFLNYGPAVRDFPGCAIVPGLWVGITCPGNFFVLLEGPTMPRFKPGVITASREALNGETPMIARLDDMYWDDEKKHKLNLSDVIYDSKKWWKKCYPLARRLHLKHAREHRGDDDTLSKPFASLAIQPPQH